METFGTHAASAIKDYLIQHRLLQESVALLTGSPQWQPRSLQIAVDSYPPGHPFLITSQDHIVATDGAPCTLVVGHAANDSQNFYAWLNRKGQSLQSIPPTKLYKRADGLFEIPSATVAMVGDKFLYNHQTKAVDDYAQALAAHATLDETATSREVVAFATGTGKSYIVGHTLKALGQEGVVIVPENLGAQIIRELREVMPQANIHAGHDFANAGPPANFKGIVVLEEGKELDRFMGDKAQPGWLCRGAKKFIAIDEAHQFTMRFNPDQPAPGRHKLERLATHNHIMAVTATPNEELFEALGIAERAHASVMTMYDATHRLRERAFRPLSLEMRQVGEHKHVKSLSAAEREQINRANEPKMRFEALAGYFGRDEFKGPDYYIDPATDTWGERPDTHGRFERAFPYFEKARINNATIDASMAGIVHIPPQEGADADLKSSAILTAMQSNLVRMAEHKHIAFAVRPELMRNLAQDLQDIHDEKYADMSTLQHEVWLRRAQSAIAEYIREYRREFGLTNTLETYLNDRGLGILAIRGENLAKSVKNQAEYRAAMRAIVPDDFRTILPDDLFDRFIRTEADIDLTAEAQQAAKATARSAWLQHFAASQLHISPKQARDLALSGRLEATLVEQGLDLPADADEAPDYYALALVKEHGVEAVYNGNKKTNLTPQDVMALVGEGKVMHVADNTHQFVTGFSDKNIKATTRIVENLGDYTVRATQILGRPIREKDGIAAVHEILGPCINLEGELGIDRHFSCYDVVGNSFLDRSKEYERHFVRHGRALWAPCPVQTGNIELATNGKSPVQGVGS